MALIWILVPLLCLLTTQTGGTETQSPPEDGRTPLYLALEQGNQTRVQELLKEGADPSEMVTRAGCKSSLLHVAVARDQGSVAAQLLRLGANHSAKDCNGVTPMAYAAVAGKFNAIREMMKYASSTGISLS